MADVYFLPRNLNEVIHEDLKKALQRKNVRVGDIAWGDDEIEKREEFLREAKMVAVIFAEKDLPFDLEVKAALKRQWSEEIKFIFPVELLEEGTEMKLKVPHGIEGFPLHSISSSQLRTDEGIESLSDKIVENLREAGKPLYSPLLVHLNAYFGDSPWKYLCQKYEFGRQVELCPDGNYQVRNRRSPPARHWEEWKKRIDEDVVEFADKNDSSDEIKVHVTGLSPLSLYTYLGYQLNRKKCSVWHCYSSLGQDRAKIPDRYDFNVSPSQGDREITETPNQFCMTSEEFQDLQGKKGLHLIFVSLNSAYSIGKAHRDNLNSLLEKKGEFVASVTTVRPKMTSDEGPTQLNVTAKNVYTTQDEIKSKVCKWMEGKSGLLVAAACPTPLAFYIGTLPNQHIHGPVRFLELVDGQYQIAF